METTALEGVGAGIMLCCCIRPYATQRTRTFRIKYRDDWKPSEDGFLQAEEADLLEEVIDELGKYHTLIGHNIEKFDLPYLRSRAQAHGMRFDLRPLTYDTLKAFGRVKLRTVMNGYGQPTKSMDMIADLLGLDQLKTKIYPRAHWLTIWGNQAQREEAMLNLIDHCERDVRLNSQIYDALLPEDRKAVFRRWM